MVKTVPVTLLDLPALRIFKAMQLNAVSGCGIFLHISQVAADMWYLLSFKQISRSV